MGNKTVFVCKTELFEIELIVCIKIDLVLNNLQRLICHKTQPTKQPTTSRVTSFLPFIVSFLFSHPFLSFSLSLSLSLYIYIYIYTSFFSHYKSQVWYTLWPSELRNENQTQKMGVTTRPNLKQLEINGFVVSNSWGIEYFKILEKNKVFIYTPI